MMNDEHGYGSGVVVFSGYLLGMGENHGGRPVIVAYHQSKEFPANRHGEPPENMVSGQKTLGTVRKHWEWPENIGNELENMVNGQKTLGMPKKHGEWPENIGNGRKTW